MTTDPRERLRRIDPSPVDAEPPSGAIEATAVIHEIERRMGMEPRETPDQPTITSSEQQQEAAPPPSAPDQVITAPQQRTPPGRRRSLLVGVGGVAAVLFVGAAALGIVAVVGDDATSPVAAPTTTAAPVTTQPPTTATVPAFSSDDALAVTDAYFEAYNAGDVEAVLALFEPDATFSDTTRADWEQLLVWNAAQGTALSPPNCTVTAEVSGVAVTVSCPHNNLDALVQAVDGPPVHITLSLAVTPDGISAWVRIFGQPFRPDFDTVGVPFDRWMTVNHPEDLEAVGFGNDLRELPSVDELWTTVDEAEENGILTARYAAEWATYLNDNGCGYSDGC